MTSQWLSERAVHAAVDYMLNQICFPDNRIPVAKRDTASVRGDGSTPSPPSLGSSAASVSAAVRETGAAL